MFGVGNLCGAWFKFPAFICAGRGCPPARLAKFWLGVLPEEPVEAAGPLFAAAAAAAAPLLKRLRIFA